jgi:hypothetical protein
LTARETPACSCLAIWGRAAAWVWYASEAARAVGSWGFDWRRAICDAEDCSAAAASFGEGTICNPVLIEPAPFDSRGPFKYDDEMEVIDAGVTPLIAAAVRRASFSRAADCWTSGVPSGARPRFRMTDADVMGDPCETEFVVIHQIYHTRSLRHTAA